MSGLPPYYAVKTLLGGKPDVNRRTICNQKGDDVCVFNQDMRPWTAEDARLLQICLKALLADVGKDAWNER